MTEEQIEGLARGDRMILVGRALLALGKRLWSRQARLDLETLRSFVAFAEDRLAALEAESEQSRRLVEELRVQCREAQAARADALERRIESERERDGQRTAFLSQIDDLEARLADNLAAKLKLHAEVERTRQAQAAISAFIGDLTDALAAKAKGRRR